MAISALLMASGVVVTLATSEEPIDRTGGVESQPWNVRVWESSLVLGQGETEAHLFFSVPTSLFETYEDQLTLDIDVEVDRTAVNTPPTTVWELFVGDATAPVTSWVTSGSRDLGEFGTWRWVGSFESDPIPVLQDCAGEDCIPCDLSGDRCEVIFTVSRDGDSIPPMRVDVRADMLQTDFGDPEPASARPAGF